MYFIVFTIYMLYILFIYNINTVLYASHIDMKRNIYGHKMCICTGSFYG